MTTHVTALYKSIIAPKEGGALQGKAVKTQKENKKERKRRRERTVSATGAGRLGPQVWKIEAMVSLGPGRVEKWTSFHTTQSLAITGDSGSHQDREKN